MLLNKKRLYLYNCYLTIAYLRGACSGIHICSFLCTIIKKLKLVILQQTWETDILILSDFPVNLKCKRVSQVFQAESIFLKMLD